LEVKLSDRELQGIPDNSTTLIWVKDVCGRYLGINQQYQESLGIDRSKIHGKTDHELFPSDLADRYRANDLEVIQANHSIEFEETILQPDGLHHSISTKFPLYDGKGVLYAVAGISTDITDRKRAHEKVLSSEQLFRSIFENAQIGISFFNIDTKEISPNRAMQEMLGRTEQELSRLEKWDEMTHPDDRASCAERYAELIQGRRERDEWEQRLIRKDGRIVVTSVRFSLLRDAAGRPQYVASLQEDITERRKAEELLRKREQELKKANFLAETALELAKAGYWHIPIDGSGLYHSSPRRDAIFGEIPRPDSSCRLDELFSRAKKTDEVAAAGSREALNAAMEGKTATYNTIYAYKRPIDGRVIWIHSLGHVVKDSTGKPTDMYGVSQDITEFKGLEAELLGAKETAETATRVKSDFLANMSHELRTPMNAIIGMTLLALKTDLTRKQADYLTKVKTAAQSLLGIINDVLDFSKIEAGKLGMEKIEFRLDDVLDNLSNIVCQKAREKDLEFLISTQHDRPPILIGDPLRLGQVLINLVNNGIKFTEQGEVLVTVTMEEQAKDRVKLKFSVIDSGIGMTPEQSSRLFQAFSQADSSITRKYGGTGLGLSISKCLVEMMDGSIWVESQPGVGSTFHFTAWFGIGSGEKRRLLIPELAGIRVLVVDDKAHARKILTEELRVFALRAESVSSAEDALRQIAAADSRDPYRLVLMDCHMPGMNGLEASRIIKRNGRLKHIPKIVIVTASGREDVRTQAEQIGVEGYLLKPVNASQLYDTLADLFGITLLNEQRPHAKKADTRVYDASGIRVLLVEDNEVNQQVATELLESAGAIVTIANHGGEAVKLLIEDAKVDSFDVILMDLQMPVMDGFIATGLVRNDPRFQKLPIIAMTAHALVEERQRCLDAGMNDHVSKPIDLDALFNTLLRWVKAKPKPAPEPQTRSSKGAVEVFLPPIAGIDVEDGLARVAGNRLLYHDLLSQFAAKQVDAAAQISDALAIGDQQFAERIAHTVKGVAGNLGMAGVQSAAEKLEKAVRERQDSIHVLLKQFANTLRAQIVAIKGALHDSELEPSGEVPPAPFNGENARLAIARLKALLEASDGDAVEALGTLTSATASAIEKTYLETLGEAINNFDFESALLKLDEVSRLCEAVMGRHHERG
jgi:PAS domain S-box-containing protein